jgi:hypothetical protein
MKVVKKHGAMLSELKKQVKALERKEKATHKKLQLALANVKKIAKTYKKRLVKKTRDAKVKAGQREAAIYTRLAESIRKHALEVAKVKKAFLGKKRKGK